MSKGVLCDGIYYCEHINISAKDEDISNFCVKYRNVYGFRRFDAESEFAIHKRIKPIYDKACIFMYQLI